MNSPRFSHDNTRTVDRGQIGHATVVTKEARVDGSLEAVVIQIANTGARSTVPNDRYKVTIVHGLRRPPVGCIVQWANKETNLWVHSQDEHRITVYFTTPEATVNVRIW